jgi:hypothetical protein
MVYSQIWLNLPRDDHHFSHTYGWLPLWLQTKIPWKNTGDELPKHTGLYWGQYLLLTQGLKFEVPTNMFCFRFWVLFSRYLQPSNHFNYHYRNPVYILHIVKDVMVVKLFPSIHPVIRPWMASYREENPGRNKYPPPGAPLGRGRTAGPAPPVFYHGQLYVAISRVTSSANIKIFSRLGPDGYMRNVLCREVLEM